MIPNEMRYAQRVLKAVLALVAVGVMANATAQTLNAVVAEQKGADKAGQASQEAINQTLDKTQDIAGKYVQLVSETDSLNKYIGHLSGQVKSQQDEIALIEKQLLDIETTNREVQPLMQKMVDTLAEFVALDIPFLIDERTKRVEMLKGLLLRSDVSISEKYRRILEAYQIELDYGRTLETYKGKLEDGREVDFVRVGRITLLYRADDGKEVGYWNKDEQQWVVDDDYKAAVAEALRMATKELAPDLIEVPVPAPQEVGS